MNLKLKELNQEDVKEICNWKYENEYAIYNFPDWSIIISQNWAISIESKRENEFVAIINELDNLCGYIRFIKKGRLYFSWNWIKPIIMWTRARK
ncbi:hypothetical protein [Clostridium gasigenes]|uniref:hypothetical protein n=1 Tax=Clostridium gasigenes TaxID=94869 RepID=UPI001FABF266|nr:hypothetical protein [Clostridium gasigenes]